MSKIEKFLHIFGSNKILLELCNLPHWVVQGRHLGSGCDVTFGSTWASGDASLVSVGGRLYSTTRFHPERLDSSVV